VDQICNFSVPSLKGFQKRARSFTRTPSKKSRVSKDYEYEKFLQSTAEKRRKLEIKEWYDNYLLKAQKERLLSQIEYDSYLSRTAEKKRKSRLIDLQRRLNVIETLCLSITL